MLSLTLTLRGRTVHSDAILVTGDVTALYTNMNLDRTLRVTNEALTVHSTTAKLKRYLLELLEIPLKNNDFEFH